MRHNKEAVMQALKGLLDSPAVNVFLGTMPVLGAIIRGFLQNDRRLQAIDKRIDGIDQRLGRMETKLDRIETRMDADDNLAKAERLVVLSR